MPGKNVVCPNCSKIMRSDNMKRHQKACQDVKCYTSLSSKANADQKKRTVISVSRKYEPDKIDDSFMNSHRQQDVIPTVSNQFISPHHQSGCKLSKRKETKSIESKYSCQKKIFKTRVYYAT